MGSWGVGAFDNDDAQGFLGVLRQASPERQVQLVEEALRAAAALDGYLQVDDGNTAVAAGALVAAACAVRVDAEAAGVEPPARQTVLLAGAALERVLAPATSEWRQLWGDGDAVGVVRDLLATLRPPA